MSTKTRFEKEAKGNSEMAYCHVSTQSEMNTVENVYNTIFNELQMWFIRLAS